VGPPCAVRSGRQRVFQAREVGFDSHTARRERWPWQPGCLPGEPDRNRMAALQRVIRHGGERFSKFRREGSTPS